MSQILLPHRRTGNAERAEEDAEDQATS